MTELAYLDDCYAQAFEANVTRAAGTVVVLDKTLFYPTGGGQPTDVGTIRAASGEYNVLNAKKAGQDVEIQLDREGLSQGERITGSVDWNRRHTLMRYHTACHIFSAVVHEATGALITGNQIEAERARVDFDLEKFDREQITTFESKTNELIDRGIPVTIKNISKEEAFQIPSVFKLKNILPPSIETIRIIDIPGCDTQACGGTHVRNTSEIKGVQVTKIDNKGKNNRRIYFVLKD
ncbi:alanyl-tRNA editing protein [Candidatus Woesearchaeota archaeon]|nr:alanyl-tRNA editing protein [Candidatus Woesearchaeota archaeon]